MAGGGGGDDDRIAIRGKLDVRGITANVMLRHIGLGSRKSFLFSQLFNLCITAMINHIFISFSTVQMYDVSIHSRVFFYTVLKVTLYW